MNNKYLSFLLGSCISLFPLCTFAEGYVAGQVVDSDDISKEKNLISGAKIEQTNITDIFSAPAQPDNNEPTDIYFSADEMINNDQMQTITATGNVNIIRNDTTVIADKVVYDQKDDVVTAIGNVIMVEKDGNVIFSDYVRLTDKMSQGSMDDVKVVMADESRVAAKRFRRLDKDNKVMDKVVYSPCDVCQNENPLWQVKARKVKHYAEEQNVVYNDAFLEVKGIPVLYTPYFSHPDPSVKRRSGFLFPSLTSTKYLGSSIKTNYFWAISDNEDLTFSPTITSDRGILWGANYNKYSERGELFASGTYIYGPRETQPNYEEVHYDSDDKNRGNLFLRGRYEFNDYWVGNADIKYVSDRFYLKDISLPEKDYTWLTSTINAQGFDNRNYASIEAYYYKLVTYYDLPRATEKPLVLPMFSYENISESNKYGAYTQTNFDFASVLRDEASSSQRLTMINSWNLPYTSPYGEKYRLTASLKSDLYYIDNYTNNDNETFSGAVARVFPQVGLEWRLPFIRASESSRQILEPVIVAVAAPDGGNKADKIPNDDRQDIEFDDANVLSLDRYAGYDRNDTGSRVSYGLNWSSYGDTFGHTSAFIAQSYRFKKDEGFGSNLDQNSRFSDYVGRVNATPNQYLDLNYRFSLDKNSLDFKYSELSATFGPEMLKAYVSYIFLKSNTNSIIQGYDERKELYTSIKMKLTKDWSISIYNRQDLANIDRSLENGGSVTYDDECLRFILDIRRYNYTDPDYNGDFEFTATVMLKTLGTIGSE